MPLYVADYIADTGHLTTLEHGAYLLLIMHYWRVGSLPTDEISLASIARLGVKEWKAIASKLKSLFDDNWRHKRIDKELAKATDKSEKRAAAGKKGGSARARNLPKKNEAIDIDLPQPAESDAQPSSSDSVESSLRSDSKSKSSLRSDSSSEPVNGRPNDLFEPDKKIIDIDETKKQRAVRRQEHADNEAIIEFFLDAWEKLSAGYGLASCRALTDSRRQKIIARARNLTEALGFQSPQAGFLDLFSRIRGSPFLLGQTGDRRWKADIDFVLTESSFLKIMEGKYAGAAQTNGVFGHKR